MYILSLGLTRVVCSDTLRNRLDNERIVFLGYHEKVVLMNMDTFNYELFIGEDLQDLDIENVVGNTFFKGYSTGIKESAEFICIRKGSIDLLLDDLSYKFYKKDKSVWCNNSNLYCISELRVITYGYFQGVFFLEFCKGVNSSLLVSIRNIDSSCKDDTILANNEVIINSSIVGKKTNKRCWYMSILP